MKQIIAVYLFLALTGCEIVPKNSIKGFLKSKPLISWNRLTNKAMKDSKNEKMHFLVDAWDRDRVDLFDREEFLRDLDSASNNDLSIFNELRIIELTLSGEKTSERKMLLLTNGKTTKIETFTRVNNHWLMSRTVNRETDFIDRKVNLLENEDDKKVFIGGNAQDILAISEFRKNVVGKVKVYHSLNKTQYESLNQIID